MLSYQHAYHAGNAADVHKHLALVMLLRRLTQKERPFCFIDTHAGRGLYDLESAEARKTREAETGVLRLTLTDDTGRLDAIAFRAFEGPIGPALENHSGKSFNVAGRLEIDDWGGRRKAKLRLEDAAPAA